MRVLVVLGLITIGALVMIWPSVGRQPKDAPTTAPTMVPTATPTLTVGWAASRSGWRIGLQRVETAAVLGEAPYTATRAQGRFVLATVSASNLQKATSTLNAWDFAMKTPAGIEYKLSTSGSTALLMSNSKPEPLYISEEVQPGLSKQFALVFDVDPRVPIYTLTAAGIDFQVPVSP